MDTDLLTGVDLSHLTADEIQHLKWLNSELYPTLPIGSQQTLGAHNQNCTCSLQDLLAHGCKCGAFKKELETK